MLYRELFSLQIIVNVIIACLLLEQLDMTRACLGWGGEPPGKKDGKASGAHTTLTKNESKLAKELVKKELDDSVPHAALTTTWGGFKVPDNLTSEWAAWLKKFEDEEAWKRLLAENQTDATAYSDQDYPENMPDSWKGLGAFDAGFPPNKVPPWAYKAKNTGLPTYCYQALDFGKCSSEQVSAENATAKPPIIRWAYNPYVEECQQFEFGGCGGNRNNFLERLGCEDACTNPDPRGGGCDLQTDVLYDRNNDDSVGPDFPRRAATRRCDLKEPEI